MNKNSKPIFDKITPQYLMALPYHDAGKKIEIKIETQEFTCLCPWSGLPDFAQLNITYTPQKKIVELKSLKYYIQSFRQVGILHENAVNRIFKDLKELLNPFKLKVELVFNLRGGIKTTVVREYTRK